jgi:phospholipase D1/2
MTKTTENGEHGGVHGFMDDLREKLHDTKLHDAKIAITHKKCAPSSTIQRLVMEG